MDVPSERILVGAPLLVALLLPALLGGVLSGAGTLGRLGRTTAGTGVILGRAQPGGAGLAGVAASSEGACRLSGSCVADLDAVLAFVRGEEVAAERGRFHGAALIDDASEAGDADAFVASLPGPWRENALFLPFPRGALPGSPEAPRVVLFAPDASAVIGLGGGNHPSLEVMDLAWELPTVVLREGRFDGRDPRLRCSTCHDGAAVPGLGPGVFIGGRPVWDTNRAWPEAYGHHWLSDSTRDRQWQAFAAGPGQSGIYRHLSLPADNYYLELRNNAFTVLLQRSHARVLGAELAAHPEEPAARAALEAAFRNADVEEILDLLPAERAGEVAGMYESLVAETQASLWAYQGDKVARARALGINARTLETEFDDLRELERIAKLRLVFTAMRVPGTVDGWSHLIANPKAGGGAPPGYAFAHFTGSQTSALDFIAWEYLSRVRPEAGDAFEWIPWTDASGSRHELPRVRSRN